MQRSDQWSDWHRRATVSFGASAGVSFFVLLSLLDRARGVKRPAARVGASVAACVAFLMAVLTGLTRRLVEWDQVGLWAVTVGDNVAGYWFAGFSDDVASVLVGGVEVSQGQYVPALLTTLERRSPVG